MIKQLGTVGTQEKRCCCETSCDRGATVPRGTQAMERTLREKPAPLEPLGIFPGDFKCFARGAVEPLEPLGKNAGDLRVFDGKCQQWFAPLGKRVKPRRGGGASNQGIHRRSL